MHGTQRKSTLIFYSIAALMVVTGVLCLVRAVQWVGKPFAGFLVYDPPLVGSYTLKEWPGRQAGLRFLDRIVAIDGRPVRDGQGVVRAILEKVPGTAVTYTLESKGATKSAAVPVAVFGKKDFFLIFSISFLGGIAIYILGIAVYVLKPNMRVSWVFLTLSLALGTYMVSGFEIQSSYSLVYLHYLTLCLIPPTVFHLFLIFPDRKAVLNRSPVLEYLIYLPALLIAAGYQIYFAVFREIPASLSWLPSYNGLGTQIRILMIFCAASFILFVVHAVRKAATVMARQRARIILFGATMAFTPPMVIMVLGYFVKINFPWNFFPFFIIFFPAAIAYSIIRHNLFEADIIIKRTVGYTIATAGVIGAYGGVSLILNIFLGQYQLAQSRAFPILFTMGVILVFDPLRGRIQALVDRMFFRKEYDYGEVVEKVSGAMSSLLDLGQILKSLTTTFVEEMFINTSSVMLLSPDGQSYRVLLADGESKEAVGKWAVDRQDPLMRIIETEKKELTKYDMTEDRKYGEVATACVAGFEALHAGLIVPLLFQGRVIGTLNLGEKKSGKAFYREDIELLRTLASQGAVAIENARLFQENLEKQRMEEELSIARELQMSMLPASCPQIAGFGLAAHSAPAKEVGGDFYDFISLADGKMGVVIGDVTGKSVSGALVMAASRSVFRMLSEERTDLGDIMIRANRRIKQDIKSGMFVALLYALLDTRARTLSLSNAGQTSPIHFSARTGEVVLVDTVGDSFPLGILADVDYQETRLLLAPGDKVILYTDGIVEAMNPADELFGFDRLLETVKGAGTLSKEGLLAEILDRVNAFAAGQPQHDDLTVIVIAVEESASS